MPNWWHERPQIYDTINSRHQRDDVHLCIVVTRIKLNITDFLFNGIDNMRHHVFLCFWRTAARNYLRDGPTAFAHTFRQACANGPTVST